LTAGSGDIEEITCTAAGRALIDDADASAQRTTLGLAIGSNVQAYDADLAALAGISTNGVLARTGAGTAAARSITGTAPIAVTNGDGVAGNPTISVSDITDTQIKSDAAIDATKLSFLQAGSGAVARTIDSKLKDVVSVADFGASPSASASANYTAIAAAIAATPATGTLFIPAGGYTIDDTLVVDKQLAIIGDGPGSTRISFTGDQTKNIIHFRPPSVTATGNGSTVNYTFTFPTSPIKVVVNGSETTAYTVTAGSPNTLTFNTAPANGHSILITPTFLNNVRLADISFNRLISSAVTPGTNIWLERCDSARLDNVNSNEGNYNFRFSGGQRNHCRNLRSFSADANIVKGATSALILCEEATLGTNAFQPFYTTHIIDFIGSATKLDNCIRVEAADGLHLIGGYINFAESTLIDFTKARSTNVDCCVTISNYYFDCMNINVTPRALRVSHAINEVGYRSLHVQNSIIANGSSKSTALVEILKRSSISFVNNTFANCANPWAIYIDDANNTSANGQYNIAGNQFNGMNAARYTGDGATTAYAFSFSQTGLVVTVNGVSQTGGGVNYSVSGTAPNSTLTFNTAPPAGQSVVISSTAGGAIFAKNAGELSITGNTFDNIPNTTNVIKLEGTTTSAAITGNAWDGATQANFLVDSGATITNKVHLDTPARIATTIANQTIAFADGTNTAPSVTNSGDDNTGLYFPAADTVALTTAGTKRFEINSTGIFDFSTRGKIDTMTVGRGGQTAVSTNTAVGFEALNSASLTGTSVTGVGYRALLSSTTAIGNTAIGASALENASSGGANTAVGAFALQNTTTAFSNTAVGRETAEQNTTGGNNTAVGRQALRYFNSSNNVAIGFEALLGSTTVANNTAVETVAVGARALRDLTSGSNNSASGFAALEKTTSGSSNTAQGNFALGINTTGGTNTGVGVTALGKNTTGASNSAVGANSLLENTTGSNSTALGFDAIRRFVGNTNTAVGYRALYGGNATPANNTGTNNIAIGYQAGDAITTGSTNIVIGHDIDVDSATGDNQINIGGVYFHDRFIYTERADPAAPAANSAVVYAKDNGSGKTQLCVRFNTGAVQVLATEP